MTPYYEHAGITIYHGDCREVMPAIGTSDMLLTDPPYGIYERPRGEWNKELIAAPEWDRSIVPISLILQAINLARYAIVWGGNYYALAPVRGWLAWDKMQDHSSGHFEMAWTNLDIPTRTFRLSRVQAYSRMNKQHPTQKPVRLMEWCIGLVPQAETVVDTFMGSGTTLLAAKHAGKQAIGIDIEERYCEMAAKRLSQEVFNFNQEVHGVASHPPPTPEAICKCGDHTKNPDGICWICKSVDPPPTPEGK